MDIIYPTDNQPATSGYVMAVLRDMHRQQCHYDSATDACAVLTFDSTVAQWRAACDLLGWRALGHAQNQFWGISCSDAEWREVLEPAADRTLAGVCRLIAEHTHRPHIRPARLLGNTCATAGAFLTVRSLLHAAGAPAAEISPSTPLAAYTLRYADVFLGPVSRLAPGVLPPVRIRTPFYDGALWGLLLALVCLIIGGFAGLHGLRIAGVGLFASSYALAWYSARWLLPASVDFGELRTFRDLAVVVAGGSQNFEADAAT